MNKVKKYYEYINQQYVSQDRVIYKIYEEQDLYDEPEIDECEDSEEISEGWRDNVAKVFAGLSLMTSLANPSFAKEGDIDEIDKTAKEKLIKSFTGNPDDVLGYTRIGYPIYKVGSESAKEWREKHDEAKEKGDSAFTYNGYKYNVERDGKFSKTNIEELGIQPITLNSLIKTPDTLVFKRVKEVQPTTNVSKEVKSDEVSFKKYSKKDIYDLDAEIRNNLTQRDDYLEFPDAHINVIGEDKLGEIQKKYGLKISRDKKSGRLHIALINDNNAIAKYIDIFKKYIVTKAPEKAVKIGGDVIDKDVFIKM